jgi:hypothetical protein
MPEAVSLATSRRPNSQLGQILHAYAINGVGRLKFQTQRVVMLFESERSL